MNAIRPIRMSAERAVTFKAWRLADGSTQGTMIDLGEPADLAEAESRLTGLQHKDHAFIREYHDGRKGGLLHLYYVKQKAAIWRKNEQTGVSERFCPLEAERKLSMAADAFLPTPPFDALSASAHGRDLTLVES